MFEIVLIFLISLYRNKLQNKIFQWRGGNNEVYGLGQQVNFVQKRDANTEQ